MPVAWDRTPAGVAQAVQLDRAVVSNIRAEAWFENPARPSVPGIAKTLDKYSQAAAAFCFDTLPALAVVADSLVPDS